MISNSNFFHIFIPLLVFSIERGSHVNGNKLPRVRGIPLSKNSLYNPDRDFECLDGSRLMNFHRVNDDYCDCADGSDEPGTPACPNGVFFCQNTGYVSKYVPSSRVNDGICDCCDASDEWNSKADCRDMCHELGKEARKEAEKTAELFREGSKMRLEMSAVGKRLKNENHANLVKLRVDYEEATLTKNEKERIKNLAEEKEKLALEKYKPAESEENIEQPRSEAKEYFEMLDSDKSGTVTVSELTTRVTFDKNGDGEVSEEEAKSFLNNKPEIDLNEFIDNAWPEMKPFVMKEQGSFKPPSEEEDIESGEDHEEHVEHPVEENTETEEDYEAHEEEEPEEQLEKQPEIQYDEETQALIDEATDARKHYQDAERSCLELQTEIRKFEEKIDRDYGPQEEFASLDGECFEHRDLEYVYSLCPFGRATQRSVSGGSEVNLGLFHEWAGPETNKYSKMKYDRGLTCWNGPARTTLVNLQCGTSNRLISVSEPNRCEYMMIFTTPALCHPDSERSDIHEEL